MAALAEGGGLQRVAIVQSANIDSLMPAEFVVGDYMAADACWREALAEEAVA
jgi:hypothetical protein